MAYVYPSTGIVDSFVRADENPLATSSSGPTWGSAGGASGIGISSEKVVSNQCAGNGGANGSQMYFNKVWSPAVEVYCTVAVLGATSDICDLYLRIGSISNVLALNGYVLRYNNLSGVDTLVVLRLDNSSATTLTFFSQEISAGDSFGASMVGSTLTVYYKAAAGSWSALGNATDSTYSTGGYNLLGMGGTALRITNFGGGNVLQTLPVAGTMASSGVVTKRASKLASGVMASSGVILKRMNKIASGTMTSAGVVLKRANKIASGAMTSSGAITTIKTALLSLAGTMGSSGAVRKQAGKIASGSMASAGVILKRVNKAAVGTMSSSGTIATIKTALLSLAGTFSSSGVIRKQTAKLGGGVMGSSGAIAKQTNKFASGVLTSSGGLLKQIRKFVSGILSSAGKITTSTSGGGGAATAGFDIRDTTAYEVFSVLPMDGVGSDRISVPIAYETAVVRAFFEDTLSPPLYDRWNNVLFYDNELFAIKSDIEPVPVIYGAK